MARFDLALISDAKKSLRMMYWNRLGFVVVVLLGGCFGGPQRMKPPKIDASAAATKAMELYDTNQDGKLSREELAKCPGILVMFDAYDTNHDKVIDQDEIRDHLTHLLRHGTGGTQLACNIIYQGSPLQNAKVVFEPEPYLGSDISAAEGVTNNYGATDMGIPEDKVPASIKNMKLIQYGTFKVRITHPTTNIPAKYNSETTLGYETISGQPTVSFNLK